MTFRKETGLKEIVVIITMTTLLYGGIRGIRAIAGFNPTVSIDLIPTFDQSGCKRKSIETVLIK